MRSLILGLAVVGLAGCSKPTHPQLLEEMQAQLALHFHTLNSEQSLEAIDTKTTDVRSPGRIVSQFEWRADGRIFLDVRCKSCGITQRVVTYDGRREMRCPVCGAGTPDPTMAEKYRGSRTPLLPAGLDAEAQEKMGALPMFTLVSGEDRPLVAVVRYVRTQWWHDDSAKWQPHPKAMEGVSAEEAGPGTKFYAKGFHRPDTAFIGTTAFVFDGGRIRQVDADSVRKLIAAEAGKPDVKTMKLGPSRAIEKGVPHWMDPEVPRATVP